MHVKMQILITISQKFIYDLARMLSEKILHKEAFVRLILKDDSFYLIHYIILMYFVFEYT